MDDRPQPTQYWLRLNHERLGMPLPAVYVPTTDLPPRWPVEYRFVDRVHRDEDADLPVITDLAVDIADPAGIATPRRRDGFRSGPPGHAHAGRRTATRRVR
jgi:hypothetical protein